MRTLRQVDEMRDLAEVRPARAPDPVEAARRMLDRARKLSALREAIKVYRREVRRAQRRASA